ncbi:MAG: DUF4395 domain-containing protein [Bacteroidales bacterium]|nr:DUF4395 domain-containing protein [Bacteroidales bacterium]
MKPDAICPICDRKIDENIARFNGAFTVIFLTIFVITNSIIPILFLAVDFLMRASKLPQYSLLYLLSKQLVRLFAIKPKNINAGPKVFAARIGFAFAIAILISFAFESTFLAYSFAAIFGICAFLEAAIGFCIACEIYPYLYRILYQSSFERNN